jgi:hypothetical protein
MKTRISGKEAARVAEDMAKPGPIRAVATKRSPRGTRRSRAIAWVRAGPKDASACTRKWCAWLRVDPTRASDHLTRQRRLQDCVQFLVSPSEASRLICSRYRFEELEPYR